MNKLRLTTLDAIKVLLPKNKIFSIAKNPYSTQSHFRPATDLKEINQSSTKEHTNETVPTEQDELVNIDPIKESPEQFFKRKQPHRSSLESKESSTRKMI